MLIKGFGNVCHETSSQKEKAIVPEKTFRSKEIDLTQEKVLGIGFLDDPTGSIRYGMRAEYAEDSSSADPIIKVTIQKTGSEEVHYISLNDVNVTNASEIEMFALCCYADDTGQGTGGSFGTSQTLNYYRANASGYGAFKLTNPADSCLSVKQNWLSMIEEMRKLYMEAGLYKQALDGDSLLNCFVHNHSEIVEKGENSHKNLPLQDSQNW